MAWPQTPAGRGCESGRQKYKSVYKVCWFGKCSNGDVAELVEGTSLLTRQGSNTFMSSNLIVSAKSRVRSTTRFCAVHFKERSDYEYASANTGKLVYSTENWPSGLRQRFTKPPTLQRSVSSNLTFSAN